MNEPSTIPIDKSPHFDSPISLPQGFTPVSFDRQPLQSLSVSPEDIRSRGKDFEPAIDGVLTIIDNATHKVLRAKLRAILDEEKADEVAALARPSKESKAKAKEAGGRIAARYCKDTEIADWAVVGGYFAEIAIGFANVAAEVRALRKNEVPIKREVSNE